MKKAFTLLELLMVIAIMALLMGIIIPTYNGVREKSKITKAKAEAKGIETALKCYLDHYRVWPELWKNGKIEGDIFDTLRGNNADKISFYEFGGPPEDSMAYDPWRDPNTTTENTLEKQALNAYQVKFDKDYNNKIDLNGRIIYRTVIVWSVGKNASNEWGDADDVASWK